MTTPTHDRGDLRALSVSFTDSAGAPADPSTVVFRMREPDGVETAYAYSDSPSNVIKDDVGEYHVNWTFTKTGRHTWRFEGGSGVNTAEPQDVYIRHPNMSLS